MTMRQVPNFSKYPSVGRKILTQYRISDLKPETPEDLSLLQMAEGIINRKEFSEREGWPWNAFDDDETMYDGLYARDLVKGKNSFVDPDQMPVIRRVYDLKNKNYTTEVVLEISIISITAHDIRAKGKDSVEKKLREIFC